MYPSKGKGDIMVYKLRNVQDHVEVYDERENFLFSADTQQEALAELELEYGQPAARPA